MQSRFGQDVEFLPLIFLTLYTVPAIGVLVVPSPLFSKWGWTIALIGGIVYIFTARVYDWPTYDEPQLSTDNAHERDIDILLKEYEELGKEFRNRDLLITRSIYLSLAISGVLATVITQIDAGRAFIAMLGSLVAFGFVVSITSQKGSRDQVRKRRNQLEEYPPFKDKLTINKSITIRDRPFPSDYSASGFILHLHYITLILWVGAYFYLVSGIR